MPVQPGYRKSRHGCLRCKERRVKCDEKQPCTACSRHGVTCSLVDAGSSSMLPQNNTTQGRPQVEPSTMLPGPQDPSSLPSNLTTKQTGWITDLELIHHFTAVTCYSLPRQKQLQHIWQVEVPRMGVNYPFVMHQILAVAALHFAYLHPDQAMSYTLHADRHQAEAISGMRDIMTNLTSAQAEALFVASMLLNICGFATFTHSAYRNTELPSISNIIEVFLLVRGMNGILHSIEDLLKQGIFAPLFTLDPNAASTPTLDSVRLQIESFKTKVKASAYASILIEAADLFLFWIDEGTSRAERPELRIAMAWPIYISADYISLFRQGNPEALELLTYHCVVVMATEETNWFTKGWSRTAIQTIAVSLDKEHQDRVNWAKDIIIPQEQ